MRLALIVSRVPMRSEVTTSPLDAEAVCEVTAGHDVAVFSDLDGRGAEHLRDAGMAVTVGHKRGVFLAEDGRPTPDRALVARSVAAAHAAAPFDAVVYGEDVPVDLAWYEPSLAGIRRGVALGGGPVADHRLVFDHPGLSEYYGADVWRATGMIGTADFVVADAPPRSMGLRSTAPPWFRWGPPAGPAGAVPDRPPRLIAAVALSETRAGYGSLVNRVAALAPVGSETVIAAIVPDVAAGSDTTGRLVAAGCPPGLELNVIVAHPGPDGTAAGFVADADLVVAMRLSDAAVGAVRAAAAPVLVEEDGSDGDAAQLVNASPPGRRPDGTRVLVRVEGEPGDVVGPADQAYAEGAGHVVFHTGDATATAVEIMGIPGLEGADLVVVGAPHGVYGEPALRPISPGVLAVSRRTWPSVRHRMPATRSLWELIVWMLGLSSVEHATLAVVPAPAERWEEIPVANVTGIPSYLTSWGLLGAPNLAGVGAASLPEPDREPESTIVRRWVMQRGWGERLRLALPSRFGMLRRAMRGRW